MKTQHEYFNQVLPLARTVGDKNGEAGTLTNLSPIWQSLNNPHFAVFWGKQSVNAFQQLRSNIRGLDKNIQQTYLKSIEATYRPLAGLLIKE